ELCLPSAICGPFCSVPPIGMMIVVLPERTRSRNSIQVSSSRNTVSAACAAGKPSNRKHRQRVRLDIQRRNTGDAGGGDCTDLTGADGIASTTIAVSRMIVTHSRSGHKFFTISLDSLRDDRNGADLEAVQPSRIGQISVCCFWDWLLAGPGRNWLEGHHAH